MLKMNNMIKRILCAVLSLAMVMQFNMPSMAFAAEEASVTELLVNGDFSDVNAAAKTATNWEFRTEGSTTIEVNQGSAVYHITAMGDDWVNYLKYTQGIQLTAGQEYTISCDLTSSVNRNVLFGFDAPRAYQVTEALEAGKTTTVSNTFVASGSGTNYLMLYLGGVNGETIAQLGAHDVTISRVSITTIGTVSQPGGNTEQPGGGEVQTQPTQPSQPSALSQEFLEKDAEARVVEGNIIKNGNFNAAEGALSEWQMYQDNVTFHTAESDNRVVMEIKAAAADWGQALYQHVNLTPGVEYTVSFDVEVTGDNVNIRAGLDPARTLETKVSAADGVKTITYKFTPNGAEGNFFLFLGDNQPGGIAISNVSMYKAPLDFSDASENDTQSAAYAPITSLAGTVPTDYSILKDGNFINGLTMWETWCEQWMSQWNVVQYTQLDKGINVWITNTGGGEGNKPWDVQLNQKVNFKANTHYVFKGNVTTEQGRAINLVFNDAATGNSIASYKVGMQDGESRDMYFELPVLNKDTQVLFSIQMGNVSGDVQKNNMVFKDLLIEVNGYTELAEVLTEDDAPAKYALTGATYNNGFVTTNANGQIRVNDLSLAAGSDYTLSFMAGTRGNTGSVTATVYNGGKAVAAKTVELGHAAALTTVDFTAQTTDADSYVTLKFNNCDGDAYADSVYLYAKNYAAAMGINVQKSDISPLVLKDAPAVSEALAYGRFPIAGVDEQIVLTYAADAEYQNAINGVTVNGKAVTFDKSEAGKIKIPADQFTLDNGAAYTTFDIQVVADWFKNADVYQDIYSSYASCKWQMTWSDEFDGNSLDMTKWSYQNGNGAEYGVAGWGNDEKEYYTDKNIAVKDGALVITATEGTHGYAYDSGRIWTMNDDKKTAKFSQTYGRFEAKISMPAGNGIWPAFWMLPVGTVYGGWPLSGELDIMEARGRLINTVCGTLHYGQPWPNNVYTGADYYFDEGEDFTTYHIYAVEWEPGEIRWYVDGELYQTQNSWYSSSPEQPDKFAYPAPFNQDFYIILNLAVGGTFDGNINPPASAIPAEMKVDYVRAYENIDGYDDFVSEPMIPVVPVTPGAKDGFVDDGFANINIMTKDTDKASETAWNLLTLPAYGGAATFTKDGGAGKIHITNGGSQSYSVQMINMVSLFQGHYYKLSFDAKADAARTIIAKIGDDGNPSWDTFVSEECKLGTDWKHYEIVFVMNRSESTARVELNMGLNTADVYLKNVSLEECDASATENDPDVEKNVLGDDNRIYNGIFNVGGTSRLDYWHTDGAVSAYRDNEYDFVAQIIANASLEQTNVKLSQSDEFTVSFDAAVYGDASVKVTLGDAVQTLALSGRDMKHYSVALTMPAGQTAEFLGSLKLEFISDMIVYLDNVSVVQETYNNVDFSQMNSYPLTNGDFEAGKAVWGTWGTDYAVMNYANATAENGSKYGAIKKSTSGNTYDAMLSQNLELLGGYTYEFSFDAWADSASAMDISMEDGNYTRYFERTKVEVGTGRQHYAYTFKLAKDMNLSLKFMVGAAQAADNLYLDNVVVKIKGATPKVGTITVSSTDFSDGTSVKVGGASPLVNVYPSNDFNGTPVLYVDGVALNASQYTELGNNSYRIANSVFAQSRNYEIYAGADGFVKSNVVTVVAYPADGNGYANGTFSSDLDAYSTYTLNGDDYVKALEDVGVVYYSYAGYDEWGNIIPWSIQLVSDKVQVKADTPYTFSFYAYSEVERCIRFTLNEQDITSIKIGTTPELYTFNYTPDTDTVKVMIQAGSVMEDGSYVADMIYDPHHVYLDNFSAYTTASGKTAAASSDLDAIYAKGGVEEPAAPEPPVDPEPPVVEAESITLDQVAASLTVGKTVTLTATVAPEDAEDKKVTWKTSNPTVATVENGVVTAKAAGVATITAETVNGLTASAVITVSKPVVTKNFTDVQRTDWFYFVVKEATEIGLMSGYSDKTFRPSEPMSRAMLVTVLHRMAGYPKASYQSLFTDVPAGQYFTTPVMWAVQNKLVSGYADQTFRPDTNVTREQLATMLMDYAKAQGIDVSGRVNLAAYQDAAQISSYATAAISWAVASGIMSGTKTGELQPKREATRAEATKMLLNFYNLVNN